MNIRTDYLKEIQQQEELKKTSKTSQNDGAFAALFAQEIHNAPAVTSDSSIEANTQARAIDPKLIMTLANTESLDNISTNYPIDASTEQLDLLLASLDTYSNALKEGASPQDAWDMLTNIENKIKNLQGNLATQQAPNQDLDALTNEVSIMATVEKFKINRGDYTL